MLRRDGGASRVQSVPLEPSYAGIFPVSFVLHVKPACPVLGPLKIFGLLSNRELDGLDFNQAGQAGDIEFGISAGGGDIVLLFDGDNEGILRDYPLDGPANLAVGPAVVLGIGILEVLTYPGSHFGQVHLPTLLVAGSQEPAGSGFRPTGSCFLLVSYSCQHDAVDH